MGDGLRLPVFGGKIPVQVDPMCVPPCPPNDTIGIGGQHNGAVFGWVGELPKRPGKGVGGLRFFAMNRGEDEHPAFGAWTPDFEWETEHGAPVRGRRPGNRAPRRSGAQQWFGEPTLGAQGTSGFVFFTNRSMISSRFDKTTSFSNMSADRTVSRNNSIVSVDANSAANGP